MGFGYEAFRGKEGRMNARDSLTLYGALSATVGSGLLAWGVLQPRVWLTSKQEEEQELVAFINAIRQTDEVQRILKIADPDGAWRNRHSHWLARKLLQERRGDLERRVATGGLVLLMLGFLLQAAAIVLWPQ